MLAKSATNGIRTHNQKYLCNTVAIYAGAYKMDVKVQLYAKAYIGVQFVPYLKKLPVRGTTTVY